MNKPCRLVAVGIAAAVVLVIAMPVQAANTAGPYPQVLQNMVDAGRLRVLKQFPTQKDGLTGYIVQRGGYRTVVYSTDGYLFIGPLYGPDGRNLSRHYTRQYSPAIIAGMIESLDGSYLITQGSGNAPILYAFIDPNCIYCHRLYRRTMPLVEAGRLRVHWIMVGVLGPSSIGRAAAILAAENSAAALARSQARFRAQGGQTRITPIQSNDKLTAVLSHHRQAMFAIGGTGTPTIVFTGPQGQWRARVGAPTHQWLVSYAAQPSHP